MGVGLQSKFRGAALMIPGLAALAMPSGPTMAQTTSQLEARRAAAEEDAARSPFHVKYYGWVLTEMYADMDYNGDAGIGMINASIPKGSHHGAHADLTRLGILGSDESGGMPTSFRFEVDFAGRGDHEIRLRHAYVEYGPFLVGQTTSNWGVEELISLLDVNSRPMGSIERVMQARYTQKLSDSVTASFSAEEDPRGDAWASFPNLTAALRWKEGVNSVKATALLRPIETLSGDGDAYGWGASLSASFSPWKGGAITAGLVTGAGLGSTLNNWYWVGQQAGYGVIPSGTYDLDIHGDPVGMNVASIDISHQINKKWRVAVLGGIQQYDKFAGSTPNSTKRIYAAGANLLYQPMEKVGLIFGLEVGRYQREEFDGDKFTNHRILGMVMRTF